VLRQAGTEADNLGHRGIGTEHLLLALFHDAEGPAASTLAAFGMAYRGLRHLAAALQAVMPPKVSAGLRFAPAAGLVGGCRSASGQEMSQSDVGLAGAVGILPECRPWPRRIEMRGSVDP
jgi:ATP-dependent Clp protease ATP-binding subunit ClpA